MLFFVNQLIIYYFDLSVSLMDQLHWPVTLYHPSTETYQKDISYKFHIGYFIKTSNQIITFKNYQDLVLYNLNLTY